MTLEMVASSDSRTATQAKITGSLGVVSLSTLLSRVLGMVRDIIIAKLLGAAWAADAFFVAFAMPNLLRRLFGEGALSAAFIPVFTGYLERDDGQGARRLGSAVFTGLCLLLLVVTGVGMVVAPLLVTVLVPGFFFHPEKFDLAVSLTRIMFPFIFFLGPAVVLMGMLNSFQHFSTPALAPAVFNLSVILVATLIAPHLQQPIVGLAYGVVLGGMGQLLLQVPPLLQRGMMPRFSLDLGHPGVRRIGALMIPAIGGLSLAEISFLVDRWLASFLPSGSVSYLYYGNRLIQFPLGTFGIAMGVVILPILSGQVARGQMEQLRDTFSYALRLLLFITLPASVGLIVLRYPILNVLFQRGAFTAEAVHATAQVVMFYALGLCAFVAVKVIVPVFYAGENTVTPVKVAAWCLLVNIVLNLVLIKPLQVGGLALATSLASLLQAGLLMWLLKRRLRYLDGWRILRSFVKVACASAGMAWITWIFAHFFFQTSGSLLQRLTILLGALLLGMISYFAIAMALRCQECRFLWRMVVRRT